jgi:hypothetical protein
MRTYFSHRVSEINNRIFKKAEKTFQKENVNTTDTDTDIERFGAWVVAGHSPSLIFHHKFILHCNKQKKTKE